MLISISRYLAIALGILTPLAETIRRWHTWRENPPAFFDDYIIGAFLLLGAWRSAETYNVAARFLAAAWAFICGMAYPQFLRPIGS
jgi:hypothetical protein